MHQHQPGMAQVERLVQGGIASAGLPELHLLLQAPLGQRPRGHVQHPRVAVEPDDRSGRSYPLGEQIENAQRATADIDRAATGRQADPIQQRPSLRGVQRGLAQQPCPLLLVDPEHVVVPD